jgi:hypothetical protein
VREYLQRIVFADERHGDKMLKGWARLTLDAAQLGFESQRVIGLRLMRLAAGGPVAHAEARRMLAEKPIALAEAAVILGTGGTPRAIMRRYRTLVRANKRRLLRS